MREAAVDLFYRHGYRNVSLRLLASEVGVQAGSLYNHISTKQDLLFVLLKDIMEELLACTRRQLTDAGDVLDELDRFIDAHLAFHTTRLKEVYIGNSELRNLEPDNRRVIVELRKAYFDIINDIVARGARDRLFVVPDVKVVARIIMGMLNGVANWYRPDGAVSVDELTHIYHQMIFRALGAPLAAHPPARSSAARRDRRAAAQPAGEEPDRSLRGADRGTLAGRSSV